MVKNISSLQSLKILLVEDSKTDAILIEKALLHTGPNNYAVTRMKNLDSALRAISETAFDVALLDLSLPDTSGFNGLLSIQNMAPSLPVIILTAQMDENLALGAVQNGAQDYLFKDKIDGHAIKRSMQYAIQRKEFEGALIMQANYDTVTGLANRLLFENRLDMAIARNKRTDAEVGIFFLDLDRFKQVNDTLGHAAGDRLLREVAERLKQSVRPYDTTARFGGDEFALIIEGVEQAVHFETIAGKIMHAIARPFIVGDKEVEIGVSIGIATCLAGNQLDRQVLMHQADQAMYGAKSKPGSAYVFYGELNDEDTRPRLDQEAH